MSKAFHIEDPNNDYLFENVGSKVGRDEDTGYATLPGIREIKPVVVAKEPVVAQPEQKLAA